MAIIARYEVAKLDTDLIKIMSTKVQNVVFADKILSHLDINDLDNLEKYAMTLQRSNVC